MRREEDEVKTVVVPQPKYWFPLTSNANDVIGNFGSWTTLGSGNTYTPNGLFCNGTNSFLFRRNFSQPITNYTTWSLKIYFNQIQTTGVYGVTRISAGGYNFMTFDYAPDWVDPYTITCGTLNMTTNYTTTVIIEANKWYTLTCLQDFSNSKTYFYFDGILHGYTNGCIANYQTISEIQVGFINNTNRYLKNAYLKDLRVWDIALSEEQIAAL